MQSTGCITDMALQLTNLRALGAFGALSALSVVSVFECCECFVCVYHPRPSGTYKSFSGLGLVERRFQTSMSEGCHAAA